MSSSRRVLPAAALSRVFFPTRDELLQYFSTSSLPKGCARRLLLTIYYSTLTAFLTEYGGTLPSLTHLDDPSMANQMPPNPSNFSPPAAPTLTTRSPKPPSRPSPPASSSSPSVPFNLSVASISSTSLLNPFFGYPISSSRGSPPFFKHGRRRKRDLFRTLAFLLWMRWRTHIRICLWLVAFTFTIRLWTRKWLLRSPRGRAVLNAFLSSGFGS